VHEHIWATMSVAKENAPAVSAEDAVHHESACAGESIVVKEEKKEKKKVKTERAPRFAWTNVLTSALIQAKHEYQNRVGPPGRNGKKKNTSWVVVADIIERLTGKKPTATQGANKWKQLLKDYSEVAWVKGRSGFGPNGEVISEVWERIEEERPDLAKWKYMTFEHWDAMKNYDDQFGSSRPTYNDGWIGDRHIFSEDASREGANGDAQRDSDAENGESEDVKRTIALLGRKREAPDLHTRPVSKRRKKSMTREEMVDRLCAVIERSVSRRARSEVDDAYESAMELFHPLSADYALEDQMSIIGMFRRDPHAARCFAQTPADLRSVFLKNLLRECSS